MATYLCNTCRILTRKRSGFAIICDVIMQIDKMTTVEIERNTIMGQIYCLLKKCNVTILRNNISAVELVNAPNVTISGRYRCSENDYQCDHADKRCVLNNEIDQ